jgi:hypothetical protein
MAKQRSRAGSRRTGAKRRGSWVRRVAERSDAMDLPRGIFKRSPSQIAQGLKRSVLQSGRTKGTKFQSAMSMLNLYVNRAGRSLSSADRRRLERAKGELRKVFGRAA